MDTINKCLSEALCALSRGRLDGESRITGLIHSGNEILETFKYYPEIRFLLLALFIFHVKQAVFSPMLKKLHHMSKFSNSLLLVIFLCSKGKH